MNPVLSNKLCAIWTTRDTDNNIILLLYTIIHIKPLGDSIDRSLSPALYLYQQLSIAISISRKNQLDIIYM